MDPTAHSRFHDVVSALAYSAAQSRQLPGRPAACNDVTQFILAQHARMPDYLRLPLQMATLGFDASGILHAAKFFHSLSPEARARQIGAWKSSRLGFKRDLMRYFESLALLAFYSRDSSSAPAVPPPGVESKHVIREPRPEMNHEVVVIGSGPGGAITACLLAEAGRDVLLIEEGPFLPLESCEPFTIQEMTQKYRNGGQTVAMGVNKIAYVEGRCVGGGSEINSGLYHRTPPEILEIWRKEFKVEDLGEKDIREHFEACERDVSVSPLPGAAPAASLKLHEGATRLGWKSIEVPRWFRYPEKHGDASRGKRQSMTETYVPRFLNAGGWLLPRTRAVRISEDGAKWRVDARHGQRGSIRLSAETLFVCAGAVQTPALLRRSGITRNVGNSLRLHPTIKVVAKFNEPVNAAGMGVPVHQVKEFAPRISFGCSISTPPYLALGLLDHAEGATEISDSWQNLAVYYAMIAGEGYGSVRALPKFHDPLVRYRFTENDRRGLADGLRKLCEGLFASGATALYPGITGCQRLLRADDLSQLPAILPAGLTSLMTIHLFSSCPMGEDDSRCATDSFGRVRGLKNLRIADASLLCTAPGVNPQGSIMALARRNALQFLDK